MPKSITKIAEEIKAVLPPLPVGFFVKPDDGDNVIVESRLHMSDVKGDIVDDGSVVDLPTTYDPPEDRISVYLRSIAQEIAAKANSKATTDEERQQILHRLATYQPIRKEIQ